MAGRRYVAVVDFGGQYSHLIARRVREHGVYSRIVPPDADLLRMGPLAVIFSGGPFSVYEEGAPRVPGELVESMVDEGVPVLGICYGHQLLAQLVGGRVEVGESGEYGVSVMEVLEEDEIFHGTPRRQRVWMSHRDRVAELPGDYRVLARTSYTGIAAYRHREAPLYGLQFHPEVRHTEHGHRILGNFLFRVAGLERNWGLVDLMEEAARRIREVYRGGNVIMAASGGVDSTTAAVLIRRVVGGESLHLVFVDTGLLREGEAERVPRVLRSLGFRNVHCVDAGRIFLERLRGVEDPEEKRRVIARTYLEVFEGARRRLEERFGRFLYLAQGTIYPDRIESGRGSGRADRIKSHHNVELPEGHGFVLIEPLADFYKDEVRRIAESIGLPPEVVRRHPFPGPGLAIRIVGEVTEERLGIIRRATRIVEEEFRRAGIYGELWQAFPVLLPIRTVGVMGDRRTYEYAVAVRAVLSEDAMTAEFARPPWDLLERISSRLVNEIEGVNRVLYDITNKPPATIEYE